MCRGARGCDGPFHILVRLSGDPTAPPSPSLPGAFFFARLPVGSNATSHRKMGRRGRRGRGRKLRFVRRIRFLGIRRGGNLPVSKFAVVA